MKEVLLRFLRWAWMFKNSRDADDADDDDDMLSGSLCGHLFV